VAERTVREELVMSRHRGRPRHYTSRIALALSVVAVLGTAVSARAGSPFYLTVERSFANGEHPEVRIDFVRETTPIVLRVLRPQDVDRFLDGQLNVSRAYEEPLADINPGHYVVRGLNLVTSPLAKLRAALKRDFRRSLKSNPQDQSLRPPVHGDVASAPDEITQGPPQGFTLVREEYLDLQKGGRISAGLYDDSWWGFSNRYQVRTVTLDPLPDGLYLLQATQGKAEAQALLQVSSLSVQVKQSSTQLVVRVIDREHKPVAGATVEYRDARGRWVTIDTRTDMHGELRADDAGRFDGQLLLRVRAGAERSAHVQTDFLPTGGNDPAVFIVTDRPIFKPGETFFYKGTVRVREAGQLVVPNVAGRTARVRLLRQDGSDTGLTQEVQLSEFGSFSGAFDLDPAEAPGLYRLSAELDGKSYAGELRVRDYVKPTFYLELTGRDPLIRPGNAFHLQFRAKRFGGGIPQGVKYEVFVYRKRFEVPAWVEDAGTALEAGHDYFGAVRSATALSEPQRLYSSVETRIAAGQGTVSSPWASAPELGTDGSAAVEIVLPKVPEADTARDWIYTVMVRALDRAGASAVFTENMYVTRSEAAVAARFEPALAGTESPELRLHLRATFPDGTPAPDAAGHVELRIEQPDGQIVSVDPIAFRCNDRGQTVVTMFPQATPGRLQAVAVLEALGEKQISYPFRSEPATALLSAPEGEPIVHNRELELHTEQTVLSPGERTRVLALLPEGWGSGEAGVAWETVAGTQVFATRGMELRGRSHWFEVEARPEYGTGFYETLTLPAAGGKYHEQTVAFRIVPANKKLTVTVKPARETTEPLKPFPIELEVRDHDGAPAAHTELSVNVVDRAVYAVQPEFRPGVLDFFYPLPRLNLGTFYSDDLQGYGYAAEILHPNFRLTAIKSNVQPVKRGMRDTAGWFPHVVTDAEGRASVTVDMPANLTEWLVTAIAADRGGRVGEGRGMFRSAVDIGIEPRVPQFLREGDVADGSVQIQNRSGHDVTLALELHGADGVAIDGQATWPTLALATEGGVQLPAKLVATAERGKAMIELRPAAEDAHTGGPSAVDIDLQPAAIAQVFPAGREGNRLHMAVPAAARDGELRVRVLSGLLGAALSAAAELVSYPYGCTEQLAHTTLPNLLLLELVERAGITEEQLKPLGLTSSVTRARANARLGVQRLLASQRPDGGFSLWAGDANASIPLTAIAARVLNLAVERKIEGAERALVHAQGWLAGRIRDGEQIPSSGLGLWELEILNEIGVHYETHRRSIEVVQQALAQEDTSLTELVAALRILDLRSREYWFTSQADKAMVGTGAASTREILAARLKQRVHQLADGGYVESVRSDFAELGFSRDEPALVAAVLGALSGTEALDEALRADLTHRLLERMRRGWWHSTFDTAEVLFRIRTLLTAEAEAWRALPREAAPGRTLRVPATGAGFELQPVPGGFAASIAVERAAELAQIEVDGLRPDEVASATLTALVPFEATRRLGNGIDVERVLRKIESQGTSIVGEGAVLERGDVVVSEITVRRAARSFRGAFDASPSDFVVVEDGVPSIAEAIEDDHSYLADAGLRAADDHVWADVKQTLRYPDRTVRVLNLQPGATMVLHQVWRIGFSGHATIPPPRAFDMYDEETAGIGEPASVVVR
jgi:alpha-2-macroglobulin